MQDIMSMGMLMAMMVVLPLLGKLGGIAEPSEGYKDLTAYYWSETAGESDMFAPGSKIDVADGARFGGTVYFRHKGAAATVQVGFWCDVEGEQVWAGPEEVSIEEDADWTLYSVNLEGTFEKGALSECRLVGTVKEIRDSGGASVLADPDSECYHVVTEVAFSLPEGVTQYGVDDSDWYTSETKILVADGSVVKFRVVFRHRGIPRTVRAVASIDLGGGQFLIYQGEWMNVGYDEEEREYVQEISGVFDTGGGPLGARDCIRTLYDTDGHTLATNRDSWVFWQVAPYGDVSGPSLDEDARYANVSNPIGADWTPPGNPTLDVVSGVTPVAGKATFKHKGPGGPVFFVIMLNRAGYWQWCISEPLMLGYDHEETVYGTETATQVFWNWEWMDGFEIGPLVPACHNIDVRKAVYGALWDSVMGRYYLGGLLAENDDADVFHVIG